MRGVMVCNVQGLKQKDPNNLKDDKPKAYRNYVFFDKQLKFVEEGSGVKQLDGEPNQLETLSSGKVVAKKNGYVYVYTSNESSQDVLFDNLGVMQITGPVLEETHYYPFGLTMSGISTNAPLRLEGKRKFNGIEFNHKEFSDGSGLDLYTAKLRGLDPQIGRWWQVDPKPNVSMSPYAAMGNNPIRYADPLGDTATVRWGTGFLGLRRHEARYVGGQWIDSKSRDVINVSDVERKGARRIMKDYTTLNRIKDFSPVTTTVNHAANDVRLSWRGGSQTDAPRYFRDLLKRGIANPTIRVSASSSESLPRQVFEGGNNKNMPSYMILGHELGHAWDLLNSEGRMANFTQIKGLAEGISYSEVNAMYWENVLRANANMPLRLWYHYNNSATQQYQLKAKVNYVPVPYIGVITIMSDLSNTNTQIRW